MYLSLGLDKLPKHEPPLEDDLKIVDFFINFLLNHTCNDKACIRFDTSRIYRLGGSERFLGLLLKKVPRSSVHISTKIGLFYDPNHKKIYKSFDKNKLVLSFNQSLEALTSAPDRLYLHWPHFSVPEITFEALNLISSLARHHSIFEIGLCNVSLFPILYNHVDFASTLKSFGVKYIQDRINLFEYNSKLLNFLKEAGFILVSHSSLCNGLLTAKSIDDVSPLIHRIPKTIQHPDSHILCDHIKSAYSYIRRMSTDQNIDIDTLLWKSHFELLGKLGEMCVGSSTLEHIKISLENYSLISGPLGSQLSPLAPMLINGATRVMPLFQ